MIINDLDIEDLARFPDEADAPLIINPNAVLPGTPPAKRFKAVGRRQAQVSQGAGVINQAQLSPGQLLDILRQALRVLPLPDFPGFLFTETLDHISTITQRVI
jgi:hypothetical protein